MKTEKVEGKMTAMEKKILEILGNVSEELVTYTGANMVEDDVIDSFGLIAIISELEEEFGIEIDAEYVTEENFGNKDCIIALIRRLMGK